MILLKALDRIGQHREHQSFLSRPLGFLPINFKKAMRRKNVGFKRRPETYRCGGCFVGHIGDNPPQQAGAISTPQKTSIILWGF
ncbi:MAG TPA: hypothetical protein VF452_07235, partial [Candidatus Binatia bacterium]